MFTLLNICNYLTGKPLNAYLLVILSIVAYSTIFYYYHDYILSGMMTIATLILILIIDLVSIYVIFYKSESQTNSSSFLEKFNKSGSKPKPKLNINNIKDPVQKKTANKLKNLMDDISLDDSVDNTKSKKSTTKPINKPNNTTKKDNINNKNSKNNSTNNKNNIIDNKSNCSKSSKTSKTSKNKKNTNSADDNNTKKTNVSYLNKIPVYGRDNASQLRTYNGI